MRTIVECVPTVADLPFQKWHQDGIDGLLLDVDGTLCSLGESEVPDEIANSLIAAREQRLFRALGLVTHNKDSEVIGSVASRVGADIFFMPLTTFEQKPFPVLLRRAMDQLDLKPSQTAMVGDKLLRDVWAGKFAGIARVGWVERLGETDDLAYRLLLRRLENTRRTGRSRPAEFGERVLS